jgi:flagellar motor component MotA
MILRALGFLGALFSVFGMSFGSNLADLSHPEVLILVFGLSLAGFLIAAGPSTKRCLSALFDESVSEEDHAACIHALQHGRWGALAGGFLATISGVVYVLANFDTPHRIGVGVALILLGLLLGIGLAQIFLLPLQARLELRLSLRKGFDQGSDSATPDLLIFGACFLLTSVVFAILTTA